MKRALLINFHESPENLHFESALLRAAAGRVAVDTVHDFESDYAFLGPEPRRAGRRIRFSGLAALKGQAAGRYDLLLLLDFPKRDRCAAGYLWLARGADAARKVFVANHLIPMPGQSRAADIVRRLKAFSGLKAGYMLEFDDRSLWAATGLPGARLNGRGYATDCVYYSPEGARPGNYVFSAGSTGRDFKVLAEGARRAGLGLKVFSGLKPPAGARGAEFLPLSRNLHLLKSAAAGAAAVVIPVRVGHVNEAAGNSIAFLSMALGKPVLTRRNRYMERFIKDGVNGFLYDSLTAEAVAAGLGRVKALGPARTARMGAAARRTMLSVASLDRFCSSFLKRFC